MMTFFHVAARFQTHQLLMNTYVIYIVIITVYTVMTIFENE